MILTDNEVKLIVAGAAAASAIVVALLSAFIARVFVGRDRRRGMYGQAFRAALEWQEMLHRVRRRNNTEENDRVIVDKFHDLQERLDFHEGWIGSESKYMRRSYRKLVHASKSAMLSHIQAAWDKPGKNGNADPDATHPAIDQEMIDGYLRDVRAHLSLQPWRWVAVAWRNREATKK
ncbi:hypothetical protein [Mycobacterium avium]|uniref:hypothetical protein n=1 Tax=Mycobacterium avium TaxID=1764 RepID=UPI0010099EF5|nr:hypothetical protein [Mycobacterium avium]MDV3267232.1 hypothetical protein [Mycobacterium avium]UEA34573.1 hypothetical protein LK466_00465 [Mycobacterium avium subsp. avium]UGU22364.1 hypothetical protein LT348_11420 [Mycobacterium avium subsp. avium]